MQQSPFVSADSPEIASFDPGDDVRYDVYIIPRDASQSASSVEEQLLLKAGSAFSHPETHSRRQSTSNDGDVVRSFFLRNQGSGSSPAKRQQPKKGKRVKTVVQQEFVPFNTNRKYMCTCMPIY